MILESVAVRQKRDCQQLNRGDSDVRNLPTIHRVKGEGNCDMQGSQMLCERLAGVIWSPN